MKEGVVQELPSHDTIAVQKNNYTGLQKKLLTISLFNFFVLALAGLLLRAYPVFPVRVLLYKHVLHSHSHFAFGGWLLPVLTYLILKFFPELCVAKLYHHWKHSITLMLIAAYGMLLSFLVQGYGPVSIIFSTLSIIGGAYAGLIVIRFKKPLFSAASRSFLVMGFIYFFISSIGPFATGPLIVMGKSGTSLYFNAIYFYLHFQYNGFFIFIVLAVLYRIIEQHRCFNNGRLVFFLFNVACVPAYFLSVLWAQPSYVFNIIGGAGALLQLSALFLLARDIKGVWRTNGASQFLFRVSIAAFILKLILQGLSAFPAIARLAYQNRNFIIAYLHLVLLGCITLFVLAVIVKKVFVYPNRWLLAGLSFLLLAFGSTELLLVLQAAVILPGFIQNTFHPLLFIFSLFFPVAAVFISVGIHKTKTAFRSIKAV